MSEINKTKKEVKENIKKISTLSKDEQIKKLTALAKKLAKDCDALSVASKHWDDCYRAEHDQKLQVINDIRTIGDILDKHKNQSSCCGCC